MQIETQESVPANSLGIEDAEKLFAEAFPTATPSSATTPVVEAVTEVPKVVEETTPVEEIKEVTPTVEAKVVNPAKEPEVTPAEVKTEAPQNEPYAWVKTLPDGVREQVQREIDDKRALEHKYRSDAGRMAALRQQNLELQRKAASRPSEKTAISKQEVDNDKSLTDWNTLRDADPALAKALEDRVTAETSAIKQQFQEQLKATVDPLYQQTASNYRDQQLDLLQQSVPNYQSVMNSPEYSFWIEHVAPPALRNTANSSVDHQDAIAVLRAYAMDAESVHHELVRRGMVQAAPVQQTQAVVKTVDKSGTDTAHADKVAQARAQKVQAAPKVTESPNPIAAQPSGLSGKTGDGIDLSDPTVIAAFEAEYNKQLRR